MQTGGSRGRSAAESGVLCWGDVVSVWEGGIDGTLAWSGESAAEKRSERTSFCSPRCGGDAAMKLGN
jgi:hypothetical protein